VFRYHRFSCHTFGTEHGGPHRVLWIWPISDPPHYSFMAGDAGDHCRGALAHLDVRSQPVAESGFRFAAGRLVRQQLGVHLPQ
ncbi:LOW QUALITY PROTEIN: hypothetical protein BLIG_02239, partial [Bifidobacterium longum subsp. infantis CCUG 52486]